MTDSIRVDVEIENPARAGEPVTIGAVTVGPGAVMTWVPSDVLDSLGIVRNRHHRFRQPDGTILERWSGTVMVRVAGISAGDDVVFALRGDRTVLGARSLAGINLRVDSTTNRLVDAGPVLAAGGESLAQFLARSPLKDVPLKVARSREAGRSVPLH